MQQIGLPPLQAHFFVFYFAVFSTLTPPVAVSVLAAAKLADAPFLHTAADSIKIALTTFIIPFAFVFFPELMSFPNMTWAVVPAIFVVLSIQWTISIASYGYLFRPLIGWERGVFAVASISGFMGMAHSETSYYAVQAVLFIGMAAMLYTTKTRNLKPVVTESAD